MQIQNHIIALSTKGFNEIHNLTPELERILEQSGFRDGQLTVFGIGSTTGITTLEYEPGLVGKDVHAMLEQIAPYDKSYWHNQTWGDDNGAAHLRSLLIGTSYVCPFASSRLLLGTWQQVVFIDFDTRPRERRIAVQLLGVSSSSA